LGGIPGMRGFGHDDEMLVVVSGLPAVGKSALEDASGQRLRAPVERAKMPAGRIPPVEEG